MLQAGYMSRNDLNDRLMYVKESFENYFGQDPLKINIIIAQYKETNEEFIRDTWIGIGLLSVVSFISLGLIVVFGVAIMKELKKQSHFMSVLRKKQQTQLMNALIIQTITPTVACFSPCFFSWYQPIFGIDGGK
uniref:ABC transporter permease n=1 Tax=Caenorhabditis tropicalis TaxID=1561998 RepID=A0A1I7U758_9PELO